jgi:hypothetical protein
MTVHSNNYLAYEMLAQDVPFQERVLFQCRVSAEYLIALPGNSTEVKWATGIRRGETGVNIRQYAAQVVMAAKNAGGHTITYDDSSGAVTNTITDANISSYVAAALSIIVSLY